MANLRSWLFRTKGTLARRTEDRLMDEEISAHLDMLIAHYVQRGMSGPEAERMARRQFGNVASHKEKQRALRGFLGPTELWWDLRFAVRMLRKNWLSNLAIVLAL